MGLAAAAMVSASGMAQTQGPPRRSSRAPFFGRPPATPPRPEGASTIVQYLVNTALSAESAVGSSLRQISPMVDQGVDAVRRMRVMGAPIGQLRTTANQFIGQINALAQSSSSTLTALFNAAQPGFMALNPTANQVTQYAEPRFAFLSAAIRLRDQAVARINAEVR